MTNYAQCEKFPNTTIAWGASKAATAAIATGYVPAF